jgi:sodium transport system ATP-binding protein
MIEVKNVTKQFIIKEKKKKERILIADDNISLKVNDGEILGILGPNGAGKTTLLRILAGIMEPTEGTVTIDKKSYKTSEQEIKRTIAFLSGNTKLYKDITPKELLKMFGQYYKVDEKTLDERIENVSKRFDLESFINQKIENLSTGQTQRVGIARCTLSDPKTYIFDEATSGLDVISSKVILDFIKEERSKGKSIVYSTHYMEEAENICDRVVLIHKGRIVKEGTPEDIIKETKTTNLRDAFFVVIGGVENE